MAGIYIHIPFCHSKCIYCGFYSKPLSLFAESCSSKAKGKDGGISVNDYIKALCQEIESRKYCFEFQNRENQKTQDNISTIYFGGGTPSSLQISQIELIVNALSQHFDFSHLQEFTIEVNPEDITPPYADGLKSLGFNRISMGIQSFSEENLRWFRRRHSVNQAIEAFNILRDTGFDNISLDLIFGYSKLSISDLQLSLRQLTELHPQHVSTYQLSIDEGSLLYKLAHKGEEFLLSDEECYSQYSLIQSELSRAGYLQYEVSNFSLPHFESLHNSNYWKRVPYLGLGAGAHSFISNRREWNCCDIEKYCHFYMDDTYMDDTDRLRKESNQISIHDTTLTSTHNEVRDGESLNEQDIFNEQIMLGLRTVQGVNLSDLSQSLVNQIMPQVQQQIERGNLLKNQSNDSFTVSIPKDKLFVSDAIISTLIVTFP